MSMLLSGIVRSTVLRAPNVNQRMRRPARCPPPRSRPGERTHRPAPSQGGTAGDRPTVRYGPGRYANRTTRPTSGTLPGACGPLGGHAHVGMALVGGVRVTTAAYI